MRASTGHVGVAEWRQVMGIDWTTRAELTEALPPAYTTYMGALLLEQIAAKEAA
jgi:DNA (cytosine-5)-methyltransferase 1